MKHLIAFALVATGCVATGQPSSFPIAYNSEDAPQEAKIYIKYKNITNKDVCLYPTNWPQSDGKIDSGKGRVFIIIDEKRYSTEDFDSGYCPGCVLRVRPGQESVSHFNYSDFGIPPELYGKPKSLDFAPMATSCAASSNKP